MAAHASKVATDFFRAFDPDPETAASIHMVTQELAENLLKYSDGGDTSLEVALETSPDGRRVRITAKNRTSSEKIEDVRSRIDELERAADPVAVYDRLIRESAPRPGVSGLGLARIKAEGRFGLDCTHSEGELVIVATLALLGDR
jgi:hypothetical protein